MFSRCFRIGLLMLMSYPCFATPEKPMVDRFKNKAGISSENRIDADRNAHLPSNVPENREKNAEVQTARHLNAADQTSENDEKTDPVGSVVHVNEVSGVGRDSLGQVSARLLKASPSMNASSFRSKDEYGVDSYGGLNKVSSGQGYDFTDKIQEEIKENLGEDVYSKLVFTYGEIKGIDSWIYSAMAQYGFDDGFLFGKQKYSIMGLDDQLNALVIFQRGKDKVDGNLSEKEGKKTLKTEGMGEQLFLTEGYHRDFQGENEHKFAFILNYLSIKNLIYFLLLIVSIGVVIRSFKFLIRQE